jgi:DNA polymerase I-like protein with 3'-5' exonuclease and polymerase domains
MKLVMKDIYSLIEKKYPKQVYILLQIHDEIIFEAKEDIIEKFSEEAKEIMLKSVQLEVPLDVHISIGDSLAELK